ncbi:MAG: gfo/Idh/MocA family oxidoreductase, partial [Planctomycetales bacterium]
ARSARLAAADSDRPLHWRQVAQYSGMNALMLGILHETLIRWVDSPTRVLAQTHTFITERDDPRTGEQGAVETPDSARVLTESANGSRGLYHLSGALRFGPGCRIDLFGSEGTLKYELAPEDRLLGARKGKDRLEELFIAPRKQRDWRVEADFVEAIRGGTPIELTDFATGVRYMEFTEAVARSARLAAAVALPLDA